MVCVGIDVAKDKHDCFILSSEGEVLADVFTIANNRDGFETLLRTIRSCTGPMDKITVISGDTDSGAFDTGSYASSGTFFSGNAAVVAATNLKEKILDEAAMQMVEDIEDLERGDLILLTDHVGIMTDDKTVIDASSSNGKVVERKITNWWRKRFVCGWKIFDPEGGEAVEK